jgi:ankyrin repeat protein
MHAAFLAAREPVYLKAFNLLLAKGADPNAEKDGTTALHAAVNNTDAFAKDAPVIEALLRAGAKPGGVPSAGPMPTISSPMVLAAWNGKTAAALALARGGAAIAEGVRTARNNHHPELAAALEKLANPPAPAPKAAPRPKKRH